MTQTSESGALPDGTRVGRTALRVADLDELVDFYGTVVGLDVLDRDATVATLGVDGTGLLVLEGDDDVPPGDRTRARLYHNAFRVPSRGALGDALTRVRDRWRLDGASDHRVSEALYFTDPEGNGVEIYRDYPREEWPVTDDGGIGIATDPLDLAAVEAAADGNDRVPPGTDVGHVHLEVSSLDAFREFYVDALGFEVQATVPEAAFVSAGGYHHHVGANTWHDRTAPAGGRGLSWFEVVVPDPDALAAVRERLADRGFPATDRDGPDDGFAAVDPDGGFAVADPDGIEVRLRTDF